MKKKSNFFKFEYNCEHKELFELYGIDRLVKINTLSLVSKSLICSFYKICEACPLCVKSKSDARSICADAATEKEVLYALVVGGHFVTMEESKNACKDI